MNKYEWFHKNNMPIYIDHKGVQKDTADMPMEYIQRALVIAQRENNQNNIDALELEIKQRNAS